MRRPKVGRLISNAVSMFVSGGGSAAIGMVFWGMATHFASPEIVGRTSAEIAAMVLLATLAQLSFGSTFERFIPVAGDKTRAFVKRAYKLCVTLGFVLAVSYVALGLGHRFLPTSFGWRALFVVAVMMWTVFALQDSVLIGLRATRWVPVENIIFSLVKLSLIPVAIVISASQGIFIAYLAPVILVIIVVNLFLFKKFIPEHEALGAATEDLPSTRELIFLTGAQYATLLVNVVAGSIVTLIVIDRLGAVANAYYYLPAQIAGGAALFLWSIDRSFLVEASSSPSEVRRHARVTLWSLIVVLIPIIVIGIIIAPAILRIFGASYATHGTTLLRLFLLSLPGTAVLALYTSFAWLDKRLWWMTLRELVSAVVYFVLIFALIGHYGILSIGIAGVVQSIVEGALFLPALIRRYRRIFQ